jgi:SAM-dependent methyltransferase
MIKLGVTERGELANRALRLERERRGWWPFSYLILEDLHRNWRVEDELLLQRLYRAMRAGGGVYKITARDRFQPLDAWLKDEIARNPTFRDTIRIHDMAASNAISSVALFERVANDRVVVHASDLYTSLRIVRLKETGWSVVFDFAGQPLQIVGHGMVLSAYRKEPLRYVFNRIVQATLGVRAIKRARKKLDMPFGAEGVSVITLFHPEAVMLSAGMPRFTLGRDDLFAPEHRSYDVVRVMNALTTHHFDEPEIVESLRQIASNVRDGGLLLLGRNLDEKDGRLAASAYRKQDGGFVSVFDLGGGYEHSALLGRLEPETRSRVLKRRARKSSR